jgi:hypothetical protein
METYYRFDITANEICILIDFNKREIKSLFEDRNIDKQLKVFRRNCIKDRLNKVRRYHRILKQDGKLR